MNHYDRHSKVATDYVLMLIRKHWDAELAGKALPRPTINGVSVGVSSLRLRTFLTHGLTCSTCNLKAEFFAIERDLKGVKTNASYHLNLYGDAGNGDVLFTHDHTHARGLGGVDHLSNTTTMCAKCNNAKARLESKLVNQLQRPEEHRDPNLPAETIAKLKLDERRVRVRKSGTAHYSKLLRRRIDKTPAKSDP